MTKEKLITRDYEAPMCELLLINTKQVLCASESTEKVDETEGKW